MTALNYLLLRCSDLERSAEFYRALGFELSPEQHGDGPKHYSLNAGDLSIPLIIELYPPSGADITNHCMLGFRVNKIFEAVEKVEQQGFVVLKSVKASDDGGHFNATVQDPNGNKIKLTG